ncbi:MAG: polysaccharide deacetylase family protein [Bacteroidetes bacterium]|nr:polysaccharide deacetylase family protein [Bacteroidota bacterium]
MYILKTLLTEALGLEFTITQNFEEFQRSSFAKINYSDQQSEQGINIRPHSILFDHGIRDYHVEVISDAKFYRLFFKNSNAEIPFDVFGAAFWLLSRYEEYLPYKGDQLNRFNYKSSLAYQYDFLTVPLVNLWLVELKHELSKKFPDLKFQERNYNFISSIDIDNAYKYKYKGFVRSVSGFIADSRRFSTIKQRWHILINKQKDPFDCYDFLIEAHKQNNTQAIYFFLLGDYAQNDKNHSASDLRFQSLIKSLADYSIVGIHPSFGSNADLRQLKIEVNRLNNIVHRTVSRSRQHFSMLHFPQTYRDLLEAGIFNDYSLGYTNRNGFRASYCFPYKWYSLDIESISSLTIHPFCISENTLLHIADDTAQPLMELAQPFIDEVKKYKGQLISIFHNNNFNQHIKNFYLEFLKAASNK